MGMFLSITSVIGKTKAEVADSLALYANHMGGGLEKARLSLENRNCCVVEEANGNTSIFNPYDFLEWDDSSLFI